MERKDYWRFTLISSAHLFAVQLVLPVLSPYFASLGYSDAWISFVFGLFPVVAVVAGMLVGELSDEVGRSWTLRLAFLLGIVAYALYYSGIGAAIVLARVVDAACYSTVVILALSKIEDGLHDQDRGRYTGLLFSVQTAAKLFAPAIGGVLADQFLGLPFLTSMGIFAALALSLRKARPHQKRPVAVHPFHNVIRFWQDRELRPLLVLGPAMQFIKPAWTVFIPLLIIRMGGSYADVGLSITVLVAGSVLQFFFGDLVDITGPRRLVIAGALLSGACLIGLAFLGHSFESILLLMGVWGIGTAMWNVSAWSYLSRIGHRSRLQGTLVGTYMSVSKVGEAVAYVVAGSLVLVYSFHALFFLLGLFAIIGALLGSALFILSLNSRKAASASGS